ncbi:MAG TPA: DUF1464 family protein [Gemmatimonadales bacterium]|nr:DUF1464 family protein [Gemmatimonadales bacterium]
MPRVAGVDPGTLSIDVCGLEDGHLFLDRTIPTAAALADPDGFVSLIRGERPPDLIAGPSGYGLPLVPAASATESDLRLAFLAPTGEEAGIGGLRRLARALGRSGLPVVYTPGVIHLDTVPAHRKVNRVDLGTADKVALAALGIADQCDRFGCLPGEASFLLLELGGAFTAALAVRHGRVVDGLGGSSGPMGWHSSGGWDGEVAYLAGTVTKDHLFRGGARFLSDGIHAFAESALKAVHALLVSVPEPREILLSGRTLAEPGVVPLLHAGLAPLAPVRRLEGFARVAKPGAQGAAVLADGLAGGRWAALVERMRIREAAGTVLDHLVVISPAEARRHLGLG